jgi:hypothetical protein
MASQDDARRPAGQAGAYEPPQVEDLPTEDGPAVTAAGKQDNDLQPLAAEWRP